MVKYVLAISALLLSVSLADAFPYWGGHHGWGGGHWYGPWGHGYGIYAPYYNCWEWQWVDTPWGPRRQRVRVC